MYEENRKRLADFMELSGKTQKQVAKESTLSTSVISQFLKGTYTGNNEDVNRIVGRYLEQADKRAINIMHTRFYESMRNTKEVLFACSYAHSRNDITLVCGDAGAGKTTALKYYQENTVGVVMVTANSCTSSATAILNMICRAAGKMVTGRKDILMDSLVNYFKDTNRLVIIDEADHLTMTALQAVRNLNDEAGIGIVLAGNNRIYNQMLVGSRSSDLQQLRTRIVVRRKVMNEYNMEEFRMIFPGLDDECVRTLIQLAEAESLRTAVKIVEIAYDYTDHITAKEINRIRLELTEGLY